MRGNSERIGEEEMNETYIELLIKKKTPLYLSLLKMLSSMLAICFLAVGVILFMWQALIIGVVIGIAAYFIYMNANLEYEYLYLDKELSIDKVMAKSKRKKVASFDMEKMEIMAPLNSYQLDSYKNRNVKIVDYSSGEEKQPDLRYAFYYDGKQKVIFEPNAEMVKAIQMIAPRKVFQN